MSPQEHTLSPGAHKSSLAKLVVDRVGMAFTTPTAFSGARAADLSIGQAASSA